MGISRDEPLSCQLLNPPSCAPCDVRTADCENTANAWRISLALLPGVTLGEHLEWLIRAAQFFDHGSSRLDRVRGNSELPRLIATRVR
jgi:hypothetical protein